MHKNNLSVAARWGLTITVTAVAVVGGSIAFAHGILESANPAPDSTASKAPRQVTTTLSEEPVPDGRYIVRDGCGRVVSKDFTVDGDTISAPTQDGQPGRWQVRFDFISSADGHRYNETYSFHVNGKKDCSTPEEPAAEEGKGGESAGSHTSSKSSDSTHGDASTQEPGSNSNRGPEVPVVPLTVASAAAIGIALIGRRSSAAA